MKVDEAKKRIVAVKTNIEKKDYEGMLTDNKIMLSNECKKIITECRKLRDIIKKAGCVSGEADPFLCQPLWDDLNAAYEALHDCQHPPK